MGIISTIQGRAKQPVLYDVVRGHYLYMDATIPFLVKFYPILYVRQSSESQKLPILDPL